MIPDRIEAVVEISLAACHNPRKTTHHILRGVSPQFMRGQNPGFPIPDAVGTDMHVARVLPVRPTLSTVLLLNNRRRPGFQTDFQAILDGPDSCNCVSRPLNGSRSLAAGVDEPGPPFGDRAFHGTYADTHRGPSAYVAGSPRTYGIF